MPHGTYSATDFQHEVVESAPPGKPLDVTAFVPEDSGFTVTLYYRTAGEGKFSSKEMRWRYKELVARVPAPKMIGDSVQYYIEVKDSTGAVIAKSAKSMSPNLVTLEAGAPQRFYPDFTEEGEAKVTQADIKARDDEDDDPLNKNKKRKQTSSSDDVVIQPVDNGPPGTGFRDVGSSKFKYMKWGSTITGMRHIVATRAIARPTLAEFLVAKFQLGATFETRSRHDGPYPHLGNVELATKFADALAAPLPSVIG